MCLAFSCKENLKGCTPDFKDMWKLKFHNNFKFPHKPVDGASTFCKKISICVNL